MTTENHNYETPPRGETDWHSPMNANFDAIDADIEIRALNDSRSEFTARSGAKYLATDTGDVYLGDGNNWNHLGTIGTIGYHDAATGTVTATGNASPAVSTTVEGVVADQTAALQPVAVYVDNDPGFAADYAYSYDWAWAWNDANGQYDLTLTVTWETDPGDGNDVPLRWEVATHDR